jgi:L-cystine uptake protein TcyP (sodium:dicarboxylate symporter family)
MRLIQAAIVPLILPLIILAIAHLGSLRRVGRLAGKAILYFEVVTTIVIVFGVVLGNLTDVRGPATAGVDTSDVVHRAAMIRLGDRVATFATLLDNLTQIMFGFVRIVIRLSPIGVFGLLSYTTGSNPGQPGPRAECRWPRRCWVGDRGPRRQCRGRCAAVRDVAGGDAPALVASRRGGRFRRGGGAAARRGVGGGGAAGGAL